MGEGWPGGAWMVGVLCLRGVSVGDVLKNLFFYVVLCNLFACFSYLCRLFDFHGYCVVNN
jgi:hypothetical protein